MVWCIYQFDYVTDETQKHSFSRTSQIFVFEKTLLFLSGNIFYSFLPMIHVNFRKMYCTWKDDHHIKSSSIHPNYQGQCSAG